jgi:hypothetical protein
MSRPARQPALYEQDFAAWIAEQSALLRAGKFASLDVPHLLEELDGMTRSDRRALGSHVRNVLLHLLKMRHQPDKATRSWQASVLASRDEIADILDESPSLRRDLPGLLGANYPRAVRLAAVETGMPENAFARDCPFTLDDVLGDDAPPAPPRRRK